MLNNITYKTSFVILLLFLVLFGFGALFIGSEYLSPSQVFQALFGETDKTTYTIVVNIRLTRIFTSVLAGGGLAISGLLLQSYFRNDLIGPSILGISSGASLAVAILTLSTSITFPYFDLISIPIAAIIGALSVLVFILILSKNVGTGIMLIIVGLMTGTFISAAITFLQYFSSSKQLQSFVIWTMGSTSKTSWSELKMIVLVLSGLFIYSLFNIRSLNALLLGEKFAQSVGINLKKTKFNVIVITGLITAIITAYCGPIAFVGLAAPHIVKLTFQTTNHRYTLPFAFVIGALFLLVADSIAEVPFYSIKLPINVITSMLGAPVVIFLIYNYKNKY